MDKPQEWDFRKLHRAVFDSIGQARKYSREGQTALATEAYTDAFDYCVEIKRRNKNSGEDVR